MLLFLSSFTSQIPQNTATTLNTYLSLTITTSSNSTENKNNKKKPQNSPSLLSLHHITRCFLTMPPPPLSTFFCFFFCILTTIAAATKFDFDTLTLTTLKLLGDARVVNNTLLLTGHPSVPNSAAGRALYSHPIPFRHPTTRSPATFSTFFSFSVTNLSPSSIGAGLSFLLSPDPGSLGLPGPSLALAGTSTSSSTFLAVEFDTLMDPQLNDINGNHVGVDLNTVVSTQAADLGTLGIDLKSGNTINAWIDYDAGTKGFSVWVSYSNVKPKDPILNMILDVGEYVNDFMYVGFSGATQGSTEVHSVEWWSFSSSFDSGPLDLAPPPPTATLMNPSASSNSNGNNSSNSVMSPPPSMAPSSGVERKEGKSGCRNGLCKNGVGAVAGVVTAGAFVLALFAGALIWVVYSKKVRPLKRLDSLGEGIIRMPKEFSYKELRLATKCFSVDRVIGHGAFGTVYKGTLPESGDIVAVKRCNHGGQGKDEFLSELSIIGTLRHRNLVPLQGWCHEKGEILLVYDLMPNGSLDKALYEARTPLPWTHRRKIVLGVASVLAYLHHECENQVIHRDIKTSNIMLDEGFNARLGDFGLARQTEHDKSPDATVAAGTMGYLAPEYVLTGRATEKTDVFSYGAVVLEVASGRRPIEKDVNGVGRVGVSSNLVEWVWSLHQEGKLLMAADPRLEGDFEEEEMRRVLLVGLACSHPDAMERPTMRGVVQMLLGEAEVPIVPRTKPFTSYSTSHLLKTLQDSGSSSDLNAVITISASSSESSFNDGDIV